MNIDISAEPDFSSIPIIGPELGTGDAAELLNVAKQKVESITPLQFLFFLELATYNSACKEQAFDLVECYLTQTNNPNLNLFLELEMRLAGVMLKKFEDQTSYANFYGIFDKFYKGNFFPRECQLNDNANGLLFFVHSPVFLAHTNPMFQILGSRNDGRRVTICSLSSDIAFSDKCRELDCDFIELEGSSIREKLTELEDMTADYQHLIWQCCPVFLSYFSSRISRVNWWSFKFNPPITGISNCITSLPSNDTTVCVNGNTWKNFTPKFDLKNRGKNPCDWAVREGRVGAFCREELIDDEKYWAVLSHVLGKDSRFSFSYCGRRPIHHKWQNLYHINPSQINFMGWLKNPQEEIRKVALVLDTFGLRHGLLGREAMSCGVPIIYPIEKNSFGGLDDIFLRLGKKPHIANPRKYSGYNSFEEAEKLIRCIGFNCEENHMIAEKQKHLLDLLPEGDFNQFSKLL